MWKSNICYLYVYRRWGRVSDGQLNLTYNLSNFWKNKCLSPVQLNSRSQIVSCGMGWLGIFLAHPYTSSWFSQLHWINLDPILPCNFISVWCICQNSNRKCMWWNIILKYIHGMNNTNQTNMKHKTCMSLFLYQ